jgi:hypothetical protein
MSNAKRIIIPGIIGGGINLVEVGEDFRVPSSFPRINGIMCTARGITIRLPSEEKDNTYLWETIKVVASAGHVFVKTDNGVFRIPRGSANTFTSTPNGWIADDPHTGRETPAQQHGPAGPTGPSSGPQFNTQQFGQFEQVVGNTPISLPNLVTQVFTKTLTTVFLEIGVCPATSIDAGSQTVKVEYLIDGVLQASPPDIELTYPRDWSVPLIPTTPVGTTVSGGGAYLLVPNLGPGSHSFGVKITTGSGFNAHASRVVGTLFVFFASP